MSELEPMIETPLSRHCAIVWWFLEHPREPVTVPVGKVGPRGKKVVHNQAYLVGETFGRWTVTAQGPDDDAGRVRWAVRCTCGRTGLVRTSDLRNRRSMSCGCFNREKIVATSRAR